MIRLEDVYYYYDVDGSSEVAALNSVSLEIPERDYCAIVGPNGSGKSTLAKHFNALLLPSRGEVIVNGMNTRDTDLTWDIRRLVGMVFQNPDNQIVATMVEEDVAFGPENLGLDPEVIRERVAEALDTVGLSDYRKREPAFLSGGQKQRLAIAGILAMKPEYIVLDEPTAMLDPRGRYEVLSTLERLNQERGIAIIHITHSMSEAACAKRVVVMDSGGISLVGTPKEVFRQGDYLMQLGLELPPMTELARELSDSWIDIPDDILTVDEMVTWLCRSLQRV
jgi:energy-coupling factor transport system ATP-binding protein